MRFACIAIHIDIHNKVGTMTCCAQCSSSLSCLVNRTLIVREVSQLVLLSGLQPYNGGSTKQYFIEALS